MHTYMTRAIVVALLVGVPDSASAFEKAPWWNASYTHRLPLRVPAGKTLRVQKPIEVEVALSAPGSDQGALALYRSLRLVELDAAGQVVDEDVPFQFEKMKEDSGRAGTRGTLVFQLARYTRPGTVRHYHMYYDVEARAPTAPAIATQVVVTDGVTLHGSMECIKVETPVATYFYGKKGAGFASILDRDGHDWISYRPGGRGAGEFRGLPKFGQPEKLFHCGYGFGSYAGPRGFTSRVVRKGPLHVRVESETDDHLSACTWDFFPFHATVTLRKINIPTYWFLYEGTPGGKLDPDGDFVVRPGNRRTLASEAWSDNVPWVYVGAGEVDRALFLANHQRHDKLDSYVAWPFEPEADGSFRQMTVLGFGRKGYKELIEHVPDLKSLPARFTIGLIDGTDYEHARNMIESALESVSVQAGPCESR